jgi:hypothetical protein
MEMGRPRSRVPGHDRGAALDQPAAKATVGRDLRRHTAGLRQAVNSRSAANRASLIELIRPQIAEALQKISGHRQREKCCAY